jgi:hypothetical protein
MLIMKLGLRSDIWRRGFRWRDSAHQNKKAPHACTDEFFRRFLLHLLPKGFVRIRHFGFLGTRKCAALLPLCFQLLGAAGQPLATSVQAPQEPPAVCLCPKCKGPMRTVERLSAAQLRLRSPPEPVTFAA